MAAKHTPDSEVVHVLLDNTQDGGGDTGDGGDNVKKVQEDEESAGNDRTHWGSQREYLLSAVGYCVGVGNVFRFPYICNINGGGAFLLPFLICLLVIGTPVFFLEIALGQFRGKSPLHVWSVCPLLKGIGISSGILAAMVFWYLSLILSWSLYYLVSSFRTTLPWTLCDQWWNTPHCRTFADLGNSTSSMTSADGSTRSLENTTSLNGNMATRYESITTSVHGLTALNASWVPGYEERSLPGNNSVFNGSDGLVSTNGSDDVSQSEKIVTAAEEFWQHNVLQISGGLYESGDMVWYLAVAQTVVVIFIFLALLKGIKTSGKVVYVTATAPYVLLTVLLIRSVTLPGAREGILFYITPDFQRLFDYAIWIQAALQVFYSVAIGWGVNQTLSSFNKFNNNVLRDSLIVTLVGEGTSVYAGFAVFSVLGYLAHQSSLPVDQVVSSGPGLAFIVYPEALSLMPLSQLWSVLFFLMLITVVFDTQMATAETLFTILSDQFPRTLRRHGVLVRVLVSLIVLCFSLLLVTQGGIYVYQLVDWYIAAYTPCIVALFECVAIGWVYGADRFGEDIQLMIGRKPPLIMKILWCFVLPVFFVVLLVFTLATYEAPVYRDYQYDSLGAAIGWVIATVSFLPIPVVALLHLVRAEGSLLQRLRKASRPDEQWGPADPHLDAAYRAKMTTRLPRQSWLDVIRN